jgi:WD40-like Beta Propeller Repeat
VIAAILERQPAPVTVAPSLERVVRRALAKDPDQRFQTARDLKAALMWAMEQAPPVAAAKSSHRWQWVAVAGLLVVALSGWGISRFRQPAADDRVFHLQINPPEGGRFLVSANSIGGIALSPDGRTAAYVASRQGKTGLWIRQLDGSTARLITGTERAAYPFGPRTASLSPFSRDVRCSGSILPAGPQWRFATSPSVAEERGPATARSY